MEKKITENMLITNILMYGRTSKYLVSKLSLGVQASSSSALPLRNLTTVIVLYVKVLGILGRIAPTRMCLSKYGCYGVGY